MWPRPNRPDWSTILWLLRLFFKQYISGSRIQAILMSARKLNQSSHPIRKEVGLVSLFVQFTWTKTLFHICFHHARVDTVWALDPWWTTPKEVQSNKDCVECVGEQSCMQDFIHHECSGLWICSRAYNMHLDASILSFSCFSVSLQTCDHTITRSAEPSWVNFTHDFPKFFRLTQCKLSLLCQRTIHIVISLGW